GQRHARVLGGRQWRLVFAHRGVAARATPGRTGEGKAHGGNGRPSGDDISGWDVELPNQPLRSFKVGRRRAGRTAMRFQLCYGLVLVGEIFDAFSSDNTWFGSFQPAPSEHDD